MTRITLRVTGGMTVPLHVTGGGTVPLHVGGGGQSAPPYPGPYEVTPSQAPTVLQTAGKRMTEDVTVGAIPSNYGLIEWNGSRLRVS